MTPWPTKREPVPADCTPPIGEDVAPVAVLAPESGPANGETLRLPAGMLTLPTVQGQQRLGRNTRRRRKISIDGGHEQAWATRNGTPYELRVRVTRQPH